MAENRIHSRNSDFLHTVTVLIIEFCTRIFDSNYKTKTKTKKKRLKETELWDRWVVAYPEKLCHVVILDFSTRFIHLTSLFVCFFVKMFVFSTMKIMITANDL